MLVSRRRPRKRQAGAQKALHMGPFAEDLRKSFGLGTDATTIGSIDIDGVNFAAARALEKRTKKLKE